MNTSCTRLVTGASDNQLRVWELNTHREEGTGESAADMAVDGEEEEQEGGDGGEPEEDIVAVYMGSVARQGNGESCCVSVVMHRFTILSVFILFSLLSTGVVFQCC